MNKYLKYLRLNVPGILIITIHLCVFGQNPVFDQNISLGCSNCSMPEALSKIESSIHLYFSYNPDLFANSKSVTVNIENIPLHELLDTIFNDSTIKYHVVEKQIVLYRQDQDESSLAQKDIDLLNNQIIVTGKIIEQNNRKPVPFANICLVGRSLGSVSNMNGEFIIKVPGNMKKDSLGISCIGFKTFIEPLEKVHDQKIFELETEYIPIQEVIIRKTEPLYLIKSAIKKIPDNYDINPSILTSFYRETIEHGSKYLSITESVLQTYKAGYSKHDEDDQIKILKGRKSQNIDSKDSLMVKIKAGLSTTILLDIIKNPADFLREEYFSYYDYQLADIISDNNRETYVINFRQKEAIDEPLYFGKIYIDVNSLAIKNLEFSLEKNGIEKTGDRFVIKKPRWLIVKPVKANYRVSYREFGHKYYLNLIRCETGFRMRYRKQLFSSLYDSKIEMVVTDIDTSDVKRFRFRDIAKPETIFTDLLKEKPEVFWENYNYIKPEEPLEEALDKISLISGGK
jgi:hypothetical protein